VWFRSIDDDQISLLRFELPSLHFVERVAGVNIQQLEVLVPSGANATVLCEYKAARIEGKRWVKGPHVRAVGTNLGVYNRVDALPPERRKRGFPMRAGMPVGSSNFDLSAHAHGCSC
jgi:hypothetical protein